MDNTAVKRALSRVRRQKQGARAQQKTEVPPVTLQAQLKKSTRVDKESVDFPGDGQIQPDKDLRRPKSFEPLPWQLERLIAAASSTLLPHGVVLLAPGQFVADLNAYVTAWALTYYRGGDREHALKCLWQAHAAWRAGEVN
jgi:hypothetical protein